MLQPNTHGALLAAGLCSLAFLALGVRTIPRTRRLATAIPVLAMVVAAVCGVVAIGVGMNLNLQYASTWSDVKTIFTKSGGKASMTAVTSELPKYAGQSGEIPMPEGKEWKADFTPAGHGVVGTVFRGPESGLELPVWVYLPPDYSPERTYRVIVMIQGFPSQTEKIPGVLDLEHTMPESAPDTIMVVPSLNVDNQQPDCVDLSGRPAVGTWVNRDIVQMVRKNFSVSADRRDWAIAGASYGGWCAPVLGLYNPQTFASVISFSGYNVPVIGLTQAPGLREQFTVTNLMKKASWPQSMYFTGTRTDNDPVELARGLEEVKNPRLKTTVHLDPNGGHSWDTWKKQLPGALDWWNGDRAGGAKSVVATRGWMTQKTTVAGAYLVFALLAAGSIVRGRALVRRPRYVPRHALHTRRHALPRGTGRYRIRRWAWVSLTVAWGIVALLLTVNLKTHTVEDIRFIGAFFHLFTM
ncbi:alpha/beta hydrolase [Actinotignum sp. GS-2025g]|uniref:alpha/beta hydrolase n=1 Tax=Actinotignum sp. GS-2025g TaxID=3427280 RepID=UPI003F4790AA